MRGRKRSEVTLLARKVPSLPVYAVQQSKRSATRSGLCSRGRDASYTSMITETVGPMLKAAF